MESFTESLESAGIVIKLFLEALSLLLIATGVVFSAGKSFYNKVVTKSKVPLHIDFRILFGSWLLVSLEFLLAADIVSSVITPTFDNLIQLGIIALIRTFLNFFLTKEISEEKKEKEKQELIKN